MKLMPKDPYSAMMSVYDGFRNYKQRRKSYAQELVAHGKPDLHGYEIRINRARAKLSTRQQKRVEWWFNNHWEEIIAQDMVVLLPKNLQRYYDAVVDSHWTRQAIDIDERMLRNAY